MTHERELAAVRIQGKRFRTALLEVRFIASPLHRPRVGVVVPRFSRSAADRNRLKRRLRELARVELLPTMPALDVSIRAMPGAYKLTFDGLREEMGRVSARLKQTTVDDSS